MAVPERSNPCPEYDTPSTTRETGKRAKEVDRKSGGALTGRFHVSDAAVPNG
jgi:hypothetical protein